MNDYIKAKGEIYFEWLKTREIDSILFPAPVEGEDPDIWAVKFTRFFWEMCIARNKELLSGYEYAIENDLVPVAALCSRAALETMVLSIFEVITLEKLALNNEWRKFHEKCKKLHLGYRSSTEEEKLRSENIYTCIDAVEKYFKDIHQDPLMLGMMRKLYDDLSNLCHPNYHAIAGLYDPESGDKKEYEPIYTSMDIVCALSKMHDEHINILQDFVKDNKNKSSS